MSRNLKLAVPWILFALAAGAGCIAIVWICRKYLNEKQTEIGIPAMVAYFALLAIIVQLIINYQQWKAMRDGVDQSERSLTQARTFFEASERPSIGLDQIGIVPRNGEYILEITIRNSGKTVARNLCVKLQSEERDASENIFAPCPEPSAWEEQNINGIHGNDVLPINGTKILKERQINQRRLDEYDRGLLDLFVWLLITYEGLRPDTEYRFEFYGKWCPAEGQFLSCQSHNDAT